MSFLFLFAFFESNLYSKNIDSEKIWLSQNLEKFSNLKPDEVSDLPDSLKDDFSAYYIKEKINSENYKEAKNLLIKGFLLDVIDKITDEEIKNFIKDTMGFKE